MSIKQKQAVLKVVEWLKIKAKNKRVVSEIKVDHLVKELGFSHLDINKAFKFLRDNNLITFKYNTDTKTTTYFLSRDLI